MRQIRVVIILVVTLFCYLQTSVNAQEDSFPYLGNGQMYVAQDFNGLKVLDSRRLNATDSYSVQTSFVNDNQESNSFSQVYYVVTIVDQDNVAWFTDFNTYGDRMWKGNESSVFHIPWFPEHPGNYTIKSFLISGVETSQVLSRVATLNVTVNEKFNKLGQGDSNIRIRVQSINATENSVHVIEVFCNTSYHHPVDAILHVGEHVSIGAVDLYFLGIEDTEAIFRSEANAGWESDVCLL